MQNEQPAYDGTIERDIGSAMCAPKCSAENETAVAKAPY